MIHIVLKIALTQKLYISGPWLEMSGQFYALDALLFTLYFTSIGIACDLWSLFTRI
jgi:hypothetical protein